LAKGLDFDLDQKLQGFLAEIEELSLIFSAYGRQTPV